MCFEDNLSRRLSSDRYIIIIVYLSEDNPHNITATRQEIYIPCPSAIKELINRFETDKAFGADKRI